jgi:nitrogen fixation-related uncharacterized protein
MNHDAIVYLLFGVSLVSVFIGIIVFYYSRKRKQKVEEPKYRMFDDD